LASHGYVVAGICGPYTPPLVLFPNGTEILGNELGQCAFRDENELNERKRTLLSVWCDDMRFVLDTVFEFKDSSGIGAESSKGISQSNNDEDTAQRAGLPELCEIIDLTKIGAFGHSFGGTTAVLVSQIDERCRAAICMDGFFEEVDGSADRVVAKPFLYIAARSVEEPNMVPPGHREHRGHRGHFANGWVLRAKGFIHASFSDGPLFIFSATRKVTEFVIRIIGVADNPLGSVPGDRVIEMTRSCVKAFFDQYLKNQETFYQSGKSPFPEADLERLPE